MRCQSMIPHKAVLSSSTFYFLKFYVTIYFLFNLQNKAITSCSFYI